MNQPQNVNDLLQRMVRFDSVNSHASGRPRAEAAIGDYLRDLAAAWGFETRQLPLHVAPDDPVDPDAPEAADNLLIVHRAGGDHAAKPWLLFDSHMDTVRVDGMTIDPFGGEIREGRLFGRGACDTKGTGAAMLWALKQHAATPAGEQPNNVALLFSVDEEINMTGIRSFIHHDLPLLRQEGIDPQGVIVGEPTYLRPVIAHNGLMRWSMTTHGKAAHSAAPELGRSAISMMAKAITAFEKHYIDQLDATHPLTGGAVCHVTMLQGGTQVNIIPEACTATIDRRIVPGEHAAAILPRVESLLNELKRDDPHFKFSLHDPHAAPPCDPAVSRSFLPIVLDALKAHGYDDPPIGAPFATHAGDLSQAGLAAIVLGPGDPSPAHTKDEWVALDAIADGVKVYQSLMRTPIN